MTTHDTAAGHRTEAGEAEPGEAGTPETGTAETETAVAETEAGDTGKAEAEADVTETTEAETGDTEAGKRPRRDKARKAAAKRSPKARRWALVLAVLAGLAAGGTAARATATGDDSRATARQDRIRASVTGEVTATLPAVFSYSADSLDATRQAADRGLTGAAAAQYQSLMKRVMVEAPRQHLTVTTRVTRTAVVGLDRDTATLLVFLDQVSSRPGQKQGTASTALVVTAKKSGARWLISSLASAMKEQS
ncbi:hypothetical protein [Actinomadura verrucosospora]|uniref:Membrane protein n=1 Tax=Actinomadura verrucosospora TaxID=46165 RepID=A0A7D4A2P5_ACTVE|nr:hypothetical protein [Actinomadura verrucosospora]QKG27086.1 membrane protein [Actinomadura verrucosospora]